MAAMEWFSSCSVLFLSLFTFGLRILFVIHHQIIPPNESADLFSNVENVVEVHRALLLILEVQPIGSYVCVIARLTLTMLCAVENGKFPLH